MEFFSTTYNALRGPVGAPQTAHDTIGRLADRLSPSTLLTDRRASVLALKGLARDHKREVAETSLAGLITVLENDAEIDSDIGKAVLETLNLLCEVDDAAPNAESKLLGLQNTDEVLKTDSVVQKLFALLTNQNFYVRFSAIQFLFSLLQNRRQIVQGYFLKSQAGPAAVLASLDDKREMVRNEGLSLIQALISQSPDIQKLLAFEGAFDRLFNIVRQEGGLEGGVVVQDCLSCLDGLLRLNVSNQTFFRETGLTPFLSSLLYFPANLPPQELVPQEFALQFWNEQKATNASLVVGILGMLVGSKSGNEAESSTFTRCLVELALASNIPTTVKIHALQLLPVNLTFPLIHHVVTPYMPVPETNGEEWDRLEPMSALDALIDLVINGEYSGIESGKRKGKESLQLRAAGAMVFENYVRKEDIKLSILRDMLPSEGPDQVRIGTALLQSLAAPPTAPLEPIASQSTHLATLLFSSLIRNSLRCKQFARTITPATLVSVLSQSGGGSFFVPADAPPSGPFSQKAAADDDEPPQSLLALLTEHLSLSFLSRSHAASAATERETREWDRLVVAYLSLLSQWLWEDSKAVREFLENGGMGMIVEPINQSTDVDPLVQGLCAFLLGVCYEFNREPGEITRTSIHAILNRLSVDALNGRMSRVREDDRFKTIGPEDIIMPYRHPQLLHAIPGQQTDAIDEVEIWFDWSFVDFWKSNFYTIQRAISLDPDTLSSSSGETAEAAMLIASLREVVRNQASQIEELQLQNKSQAQKDDNSSKEIIASLQEQITLLTNELAAERQKRIDTEKEQEDLLVLLDELSTKRRREKDRMRGAGLEVSDDEEADEEDDAEE